MTERELFELIETVLQRHCEEQVTEVKSAHLGCPKKLYDIISAFSNQDSGGVLLFGLDEQQNFAKVGVYDAQDLQQKIMEQCEQMTPVVRPVFTVCHEEEMVFVSAEIPPIDLTERPCFHTARGRLKGSYVRVGDADKPMTDYEVYSYEAFRKKYRDDIRAAEEGTFQYLNHELLNEYLQRMKVNRPNLERTTTEQQYEFNGITRNGHITLAAVLLFGLYPQAYYPRLCIAATCVPGMEKGQTDPMGNRFTDTKRIEGTLPEMLTEALNFVRNNMRTATRIDQKTGERIDIPQYPIVAVREAILNALIHRDYSIHTEGMPIQLDMYTDRMEIINPGGLYGRLTVDQLGKTQPDTRNPVLVTAMETLGKAENRYSGIPTIRSTMSQYSLPEPVFENANGSFKVVLYHTPDTVPDQRTPTEPKVNIADEKGLLVFCQTPRTREEIIQYLGLDSAQYALRRYLAPLIQTGQIRMTIPETPRSRRQQYVTQERAVSIP